MEKEKNNKKKRKGKVKRLSVRGSGRERAERKTKNGAVPKRRQQGESKNKGKKSGTKLLNFKRAGETLYRPKNLKTRKQGGRTAKNANRGKKRQGKPN